MDIRERIKRSLDRLQYPDYDLDWTSTNTDLSPIIEALNQIDAKWTELFDYDWLAFFAQDYIKHGKPIPKQLDKFVCDVLSGKIKRDNRGPRFYQNYGRNAVISNAVWSLVDAGYKPYRNDVTEVSEECACDIVANYLQEIGVELDYKSVAEIWRTRPKIFDAFLSHK